VQHAKGNSWNPRPHHPPPNTTGQKAWEQTRPRPAPLHQWDALTYTDASRRRVKLPCGRAVIRLGAAVYTPHDGHRVQTVDPGHNPDGDTANHAELVAIHAAIATRGSRPASPIVTDCAAAIDQIINVVHQPAKLTFHRHRAPSTHLRPSGKESRQATRPNRAIEGGRPLGRHRKQLG
jgi:hypothetical protein